MTDNSIESAGSNTSGSPSATSGNGSGNPGAVGVAGTTSPAPTSTPNVDATGAAATSDSSAASESPSSTPANPAGTFNPYNYNGQYNKHYNTTNNNKNYNGRPYNNNNNRHYNSSTAPNANSSPSNRKPYNQKLNNQPNYNYNAYPPVYNPYGFIPYGGYQVMPNMQMPYGVQPQAYAPIPGGTKVKLTTKDGKVVDLEKKKQNVQGTQSTASSSPGVSAYSSPVASQATIPVIPVASPISPAQASPAHVTPSPTVPAAIPVQAPPANSAAEEFKRKIRERAEAAKRAADAKSAPPASTQPKVEEKKEEKAEIVEPKVEAPKVETPKVEAPKVEAPKVETTDVVAPKAETPEVETPKTETPEVETPKVETTDVEAPNVETSEVESKEVEESEQSAVSSDEKINEPVVEDSQPEVQEKIASVEHEAEAETVKETTETTQDDAVTDAETKDKEEEVEKPEEDEEEEEPESGFTISKFLDRLKESTSIEDPFSVTYPENIVGVDATKKLEGKKYRYDPQFLIQFRSVVQFPMDAEFKSQLEKVDINPNFGKKGGAGSQNRSMSKFGNQMSGRYGNQMPGRGPQFNDTRQNSKGGSKRRGGGSSRDKSVRKGNQSKRGGREYGQKDDDKPAEDVKPLEVSANRWVPRSRTVAAEVKYAEDGSVILEEADIERKVKSLLNKLTLEMFTEITDEVLQIASQSKWEKDSKTVRQIISLTFAKACDEPYWSEMYAKFCAKLCTNIPQEVTDETITLKDGLHPSGGALTRRLLLTTCQTEYEKGWSDKLPTNEDGSPIEPEMMSDDYYSQAAAKRRGLGLVKFIGHLYNLGMLNDQVIYVCLRDQCKNVVDPSDDILENLVQLVKTVGPKLDSDERKKTILKIVFENTQKILDNCKLSSRIMFMLMDLQDLRRSKWVSEKADAGPKTIEEIHRDAEIKRMEDQKASNEKKQRRHNESRSNSSRANSSWNNNNNSSNNSFGGMKKSPSFATARQQFNGSNSSATSDAGLQRETSKRSESTHINRFAALGDDDDANDNEEAETTE